MHDKQTPLGAFIPIIGFVLSFFHHSASSKHKYSTKSVLYRGSECNTQHYCLLSIHFACHYSFCLVVSFFERTATAKVCCVLLWLWAHRPLSVGLGLMKLLWSVRKAEMDTALIAQTDRGKLSFTFRSTYQHTHTYISVCVNSCPKYCSERICALIWHTHICKQTGSHTVSPVSERNWLFHTNLDQPLCVFVCVCVCVCVCVL